MAPSLSAGPRPAPGPGRHKAATDHRYRLGTEASAADTRRPAGQGFPLPRPGAGDCGAGVAVWQAAPLDSGVFRLRSGAKSGGLARCPVLADAPLSVFAPSCLSPLSASGPEPDSHLWRPASLRRSRGSARSESGRSDRVVSRRRHTATLQAPQMSRYTAHWRRQRRAAAARRRSPESDKTDRRRCTERDRTVSGEEPPELSGTDRTAGRAGANGRERRGRRRF